MTLLGRLYQFVKFVNDLVDGFKAYHLGHLAGAFLGVNYDDTLHRNLIIADNLRQFVRGNIDPLQLRREPGRIIAVFSDLLRSPNAS